MYVGARSADSQLVQLVAPPTTTTGAGATGSALDSQVQVVETYGNLGPILDFCVVDLERQGQVRSERTDAKHVYLERKSEHLHAIALENHRASW